MASEPAYQALFLGAGPQMQCGVGQFTRRLCEAIGKLAPDSCATLTLTRSEGSVLVIWRPLLALLMARLRGRRIVLIQHEWAGLHRLRRITYLPALWLADTIVMFSPLVRRELAADRLAGWAARKCVLAP